MFIQQREKTVHVRTQFDTPHILMMNYVASSPIVS